MLKRRQSDQLDVALMLKIGAGILAAGMWLGSLQMKVNDLTADHAYHYGQH